MKFRWIGLIALLSSLFCVSFAQADPTASVSLLGFNGEGNRLWIVEIDPDESLFTDFPDVPDRGVGDSLAVELAFDIDGSPLGDVEVETTNWPFENPGSNPFTETVTEGLWTDEDEGLIVLFAAFGSKFLTSPDPIELMTIETLGGAKTTVRWGEPASGDPLVGNLISQGGMEFHDSGGMLMAIPEPSTIAMAGFALVGALGLLRRRQ